MIHHKPGLGMTSESGNFRPHFISGILSEISSKSFFIFFYLIHKFILWIAARRNGEEYRSGKGFSLNSHRDKSRKSTMDFWRMRLEWMFRRLQVHR